MLMNDKEKLFYHVVKVAADSPLPKKIFWARAGMRMLL